MNRLIKCLIITTWVVLAGVFVNVGCASRPTDYTQRENWASFEVETENTRADVFFICPTVFLGDSKTFNMPLSDAQAKAKFLGATLMEKGIYDEESRFFAPYYRQIGLNVYAMEEKLREDYLETAYADVKTAFIYYLKTENRGRPIILAGFSQGAEMCLRLLKDCFQNDAIRQRLVACYAIGWRVTSEDLVANPHLKCATGEHDTGVIVSFNSEAESITHSLMIPEGSKTFAINPLNWKTDATLATKTENKGACFTNYKGEIVREIPSLTGAYIDPVRGSLKVTDVTPEAYPPVLSLFNEGIYHLYDYQFFYRNLQDNVRSRLNAFQRAESNIEH